MRLRHTITSGITAVLTAASVALGLGATAPAHAAPAGNVVVFGDSYAANPDKWKNYLNHVPGSSTNPAIATYPSTGGCLQGPDNWPRQLQARTGIPVADWSCSGNNSGHLAGRINGAIASGDLHPGTRAVVISIGFNDYWPGAVLELNTTYNQQVIQDTYVTKVREAAARIRSVAPSAKIIMPGMLTIAEPYGANMVCFVNVVPNLPGGVPFPLLRQVETFTADNQRRAAREIGAQFIDIREASRYHNTCVKDADRWVSGYIDTTTANYTMSLHPSRAGSAFVAGEVARAL